MKKRGLPAPNELVFCKIDKVTQFAAWGELIEYDARCIIHISEVIGKWIKDVRKYVKEGKVYIAKVLKIEPEKNLVSLSIRRVSRREKKEKLNEYRREKRAEKVLELVAKQLHKDLKQTYEEIGFSLQEKFGGLFNAFEEISKAKREKLAKIVPDKWLEPLIKASKEIFKEKEIEIRFNLKVRSLLPDGIEVIKRLLSKLEKNTGASVTYVSAPVYRLELKTKNPKVDEKRLIKRLEVLKKANGIEFDYERLE